MSLQDVMLSKQAILKYCQERGIRTTDVEYISIPQDHLISGAIISFLFLVEGGQYGLCLPKVDVKYLGLAKVLDGHFKGKDIKLLELVRCVDMDNDNPKTEEENW